MSQYNISHAKDQATSSMEDFEQFAEMHPSFIAECRCSLARMKVEDLPQVILLSSSFPPVLEKISLKLVVKIYEAEIEFLNSQEKSYQFIDSRTFLESPPPPKREEIPLSVEVQEEDDPVLKSHIEDVVEDALIEAAQDADSLPVMASQKEEIIYHVFIDPVAEYMEALIGSMSQALILCKSQLHQRWSPRMVASVLKIHMQSILRLSLMSSQFFFPFSLLLDWLHWHYCIT